MNQQQTGLFLKELRNQNQLTQAQFAEIFGVSNRTVSRWETGVNMPDFDILIEIADFYEVSIREIIEGERSKNVNSKQKEELLLVADYTNQEKRTRSKLMFSLFLIGFVALIVFSVLNATGKYEFISSFFLGIVAGVLLLGALVNTRYLAKISEFKIRLLNSKNKSNQK